MIDQPAVAFCTSCLSAPGDMVAPFLALAGVLWLSRRRVTARR